MNFQVHIAAIDNGLAFPFKHPDEWRACEYILRVQIIGDIEVHKIEIPGRSTGQPKGGLTGISDIDD